jgi:hypothetical protein
MIIITITIINMASITIMGTGTPPARSSDRS